MTLPDKLKDNQACFLDIKGDVVILYIYNELTDKSDKEYKLPKWLSEEILFAIEMAKDDGKKSMQSSFRKLLDI